MQLPEWSNGIGKHILKVESGAQAVGNFRGPVTKFYQHWSNGRSVVCPGRDTCQLCKSPNEDERKSNGRFRVNFVPKGATSAMVFEGGKRVYEQLVQLNKDVPLEKAWVRVSVMGQKKDKQTMLAIVPGESGMVKSAEEAALAKVALHDLSVTAAPEAAEEETDDVPF